MSGFRVQSPAIQRDPAAPIAGYGQSDFLCLVSPVDSTHEWSLVRLHLTVYAVTCHPYEPILTLQVILVRFAIPPRLRYAYGSRSHASGCTSSRRRQVGQMPGRAFQAGLITRTWGSASTDSRHLPTPAPNAPVKIFAPVLQRQPTCTPELAPAGTRSAAPHPPGDSPRIVNTHG